MNNKLYNDINNKLDHLNNVLCDNNVEYIKKSDNVVIYYIFTISFIVLLMILLFIFVKYINFKYSKNELDDIPVPKIVTKSVPEKIPIVKPKPKPMPKPIPEPIPMPNPIPEPKPKPEPKSKPEPEAMPEPKPKPEPKVKELPKENIDDDDFTFCYYKIDSNDNICYVV